MLRPWFLTIAMLVLPLASASADAPPDPATNAALQYWQAFASLPRLTDAEEKSLNDDCVTMPLDAHARDLVSRAEYSLRMMHRGAALAHCEWAIGFDEGVAVKLSHAQAARVLGSLVCLRARIRFEELREKEALDDVIAALTLGRHVSRDRYLISILVRYALEDRIGRTLAAHLPDLNVTMLKDLRTRLGALPPGGSTVAAVRTEEQVGVDWLVRMVKDVERRVVAGESQEKILAAPNETVVRELVARCGSTAAVLKAAEAMRPWYRETADSWDLPLDSFAKQQERLTARYTGNPVFETFTPGIASVRQAQARADVRRALLATAIDIQLEGRDALKNHHDPVAGGRFEYHEFPGGFELRSTWKPSAPLSHRDDTPGTLIIGKRGK
jgi:hypothetical protein